MPPLIQAFRRESASPSGSGVPVACATRRAAQVEAAGQAAACTVVPKPGRPASVAGPSAAAIWMLPS
ncbi:MAG: hypothetical protein R3F55_25995 [Alphaproteobacteria bacterium]